MQMMDEATELCARAAVETNMGRLLAMSVEATTLLGRMAAARATHAALNPWVRRIPSLAALIEREQDLPSMPVPPAAHMAREPISALVPTLY